MWRNSRSGYGWTSIAVHWIAALVIVTLFALGLWMTGLAYTHPWYNRAPALHESLGILGMALIAFRLVWRVVTVTPEPGHGLRRWERVAALAVHWLMYVLMVMVFVTGYAISTAGGEPVSVFGWFEAPALVHGFEHQADIAGWLHYYSAWALILLAAVHTLAALKHHFIDRDATLVRMLQGSSANHRNH